MRGVFDDQCLEGAAMPYPSKPPSYADRFLGYAFGMLQEFFSGFDSGASLVKLPILMAGLTVSIVYAPYVLLGGTVFGIACLIKIAYDEYTGNDAEFKKIRQKRQLDRQIKVYEQEALDSIQHQFANTPKIRSLRLAAYRAGKNYQEVERLVQNETTAHIKAKYPFLYENPTLDQNHLDQLLRVVLSEYIDTFGEQPLIYRKKNGHFPAQHKIARLIEQITGINSHSRHFHHRVYQYLENDKPLQAKYHRMFLANGGQPADESFLIKRWHNLNQIIKRLKPFLSPVNKIINRAIEFSAGSGLAASLLRTFEVIQPSHPIGLILSLVIVGGGVVFTGISAVYKESRSETRKRNIDLLEKEIAQAKNKLESVKRLRKLHKKKEQLTFHQGFYRNSDSSSEDVGLQPSLSYPKAMYLRAALRIVGTTIVAVGKAAGVGLGIAWVGTVLFPAITLLAPTLALGGFFSPFYIFSHGRQQFSSIKDEFNKYQEVQELNQMLHHKYYPTAGLRLAVDLTKDKRALLKDVLNEYVAFLKTLWTNNRVPNGRFPRQEKVMKLIEDITGLSRDSEPNGKVQRFGNDHFFNNLAYYIKGSDTDSAAANSVVQNFKDQLLKSSDSRNSVGLTSSPVMADSVVVAKKGFFGRAFNFIKQHAVEVILTVIGAIVLPLFLAGGPVIAVIAPVAGIIIGAYLLTKAVSYVSHKNVMSLEDEKQRCLLVERKYKIEHLKSSWQASHGVISTQVQASQTQVKPTPTNVVKPVISQPPADIKQPIADKEPVPSSIPPPSINQVLASSMHNIFHPGSTNNRKDVEGTQQHKVHTFEARA